MSEETRRLLLTPPGVVASVSGAPESWIGSPVDALEAPPAVRQAAHDLAGSVRPGRLRHAFVAGPQGTSYEMVAAAVLPLRAEPLDLGGLLASALVTLQGQAKGQDVTLTLAVEPHLPRVVADAEKLAWVVVTLVGNALRHVRPGSRVRPGGTIQVSARRLEGAPRVAVSVDDDGPGIPAEQLPWLFTRAPGAAHAVGLALSLAREVLEAHGGTIEIGSQTRGPDHGTSVRLTLPALSGD